MLGVDLGNTQLVRTADATDLLFVMAWMTRRYGAPQAPRVPSPIKPYPLINTRQYDENLPYSLAYWATDQFTRLKQECGMENWSVQIRPSGIRPDQSSEMEFSNKEAAQSQEPYIVDKYGRPVISFPLSICERPGVFAGHMLIRLSKIRLIQYELNNALNAKNSTSRILASAAFGGQGFTLLSIAEQLPEIFDAVGVKPKLSVKTIQNILIYSTCLGLLCHNRTPEYIVASYGCILPTSMRKKILRACTQLEAFDTEISILKLHIQETRRKSHEQAIRTEIPKFNRN